MTFWESARIAVRGLRASPLRSLLTMLGIIIGVAAVIVLVAFGTGLQRFVADAFGPLANQIQIMPDRGGLSGSGKSTAAAAIAAGIGTVPGARVLSSDRIRKSLHGVAPEVRLAPDAYRPEVSARVYDAMRERAAALLAAGQSVVVDAVFDRPDERGCNGVTVAEPVSSAESGDESESAAGSSIRRGNGVGSGRVASGSDSRADGPATCAGALPDVAPGRPATAPSTAAPAIESVVRTPSTSSASM